jgi:antitoxin CptB
MTNNNILKKKIIFRSTHRGTKEMDLLLGNFVQKYINSFSDKELLDLNSFIQIEDKILEKWYFNNIKNKNIPVNKISQLLSKFKI